MSALFLEQAAKNTGKEEDMDPQCEVQGPWETAGRNVLTGIISSLLSRLPVMGVAGLMRRRFKYNASWDPRKRSQQRMKWLILDFAMWTFLAVYIGFCSLFVFCFVANVNGPTARCWLMSVATILFQQLVTVPMLKAAAFASIAQFHLTVQSTEHLEDRMLGSVRRLGGLKAEHVMETEERLRLRNAAAVEMQRRVRGGLARMMVRRLQEEMRLECDAKGASAQEEPAEGMAVGAVNTLCVVDPPQAPLALTAPRPNGGGWIQNFTCGGLLRRALCSAGEASSPDCEFVGDHVVPSSIEPPV